VAVVVAGVGGPVVGAPAAAAVAVPRPGPRPGLQARGADGRLNLAHVAR
jgi:hypothetical protein